MFAKNPQHLGDGFVKTAGTHFDSVFNAVEVNARNPARFDCDPKPAKYPTDKLRERLEVWSSAAA
jgi:hypothetical protein